MTLGPTQNYDDASLGVWKSRPILAGAVRTALIAVPIVLSVGFGLAAARWFPPDRLGVDRWLWLLVEVGCATAVLVVATRLARTLMPLTTLLRLTTYFPDQAPSRLAVSMRQYSPAVLYTRPSGPAPPRGLRPQDEYAARILQLVRDVGEHDPLTRAHCERVQAYSALIGKELGLSAHDAAKLSWAALLHDVGKLRIPTSVLSKPGQPTAAEWHLLLGHPEAGMEITEPLGVWLGPWLDAIGQHHEYWDGAGYPQGLAGTQISQGARIVAVADAYDTITSARSYKKALPAAAARAELARCAGQQFDPEVVRAFLAIGLGRLRRVAGPVSLLSVIPALRLPGPDLPSVAQKLTTAAAVKGVGVVGAVLALSMTATVGGALPVVSVEPESAGGVDEPSPHTSPALTPDPGPPAPTDLPAPAAPQAAEDAGTTFVAVTPPQVEAVPEAGPPASEPPPPAPPAPAPVAGDDTKGPPKVDEPAKPDEPSKPAKDDKDDKGAKGPKGNHGPGKGGPKDDK